MLCSSYGCPLALSDCHVGWLACHNFPNSYTSYPYNQLCSFCIGGSFLFAIFIILIALMADPPMNIHRTKTFDAEIFNLFGGMCM